MTYEEQVNKFIPEAEAEAGRAVSGWPEATDDERRVKEHRWSNVFHTAMDRLTHHAGVRTQSWLATEAQPKPEAA